MPLIVAIPVERRAGETRVAATPETVKKLKGLGLDVRVEAGAGAAARISDDEFAGAGATVVLTQSALLSDADVVLKVRGPMAQEIAQIKKGTIVVGLLAPASERELINRMAAAGITAFAMEYLPRISSAQSMDVLSSQANLAGYKAAIDAAAQF